MFSDAVVSYIINGRFAIVRLNKPQRLNALCMEEFYELANILLEIDLQDAICVTVLTGTGRFFSAGADISSPSPQQDPDRRQHLLKNFLAGNIFLTHAAASHSKLLVVALNGPAVGGSAAVVSFADFIYAAPHSYLLFPFTSLGLVAEVGTSRTLVRRMGMSLANEALLLGRKITAVEMLKCGFVNKVIGSDASNRQSFLDSVLTELEQTLGDHVDVSSLVRIKALIQSPERDVMAKQNVAEVFAGLERLASGAVDTEMEKVRNGSKRHKL
ncbi:uncharacterized protein A1O9_02591 [Exophiala aquamarina CBS 119918]|uniref:Enoyl-CoA hydratase n=1 Tax=Exophiala aquamarina CBS 119918 TaxID=1182545 RepID=A0A072PMN0_9EURO|nr:uncharacterized protein A1O9_02591 [Exophiala aquamarina CBS 119918]KEF61027.1 hypothetical protein A1O9_02591 [Exophiala aquamarina CBS 119918]